MAQQQGPESDFIDELHIETPVIDMQDLEHNPGPQTRVSNKGMRIEPTMDGSAIRDFAKEDEAALAELEALERLIRG
jgi:hypothetical protein